MRYDLHTHTVASDGELAPQVLVERAKANGVTHLAITDHDTVAAYDGLAAADLALIPGIELSTYWSKRGIHVVGLNIDPDCPELAAGICEQQRARERRAEKIAARLQRAGCGETLEGARREAGDGAIGRPHFARHLLAAGQVRTVREAFRKYLGNGKPGDVRSEWASLDTVVRWIRSAGGAAVLAHPAHYKMTRTKLVELIRDFRAAGGEAIEVVSGRQDAATTARLARLAADSGCAASTGSDFHRPGGHWADVGGQPALPPACRPVWQLWE